MDNKPLLQKIADEIKEIEKQMENLEGHLGEFDKHMKGLENQLQEKIGDPEK